MSKDMASSRRLRGLATILSAVANPHRIMILEFLEQNPRRYGEIAEALGVTQAALAHHLKKLEAAGLVEHKNEVYKTTSLGRKILYLIKNMDVISAQDVQVYTTYGFSVPLEEYLDLILSSSTVSCRKRLLSEVVKEVKEAIGSDEGVPQSTVNSMAEVYAARLRCPLKLQGNVLGLMGREITEQAVSILSEAGLWDLVRSNLILFDSEWERGASSIFLPSPNSEQLKKILKNAELFSEIVLKISPETGGEINYLLDLLLAASPSGSATLLMDISQTGELTGSILSTIETRLPLGNIILVFKGWEHVSEKMILLLTRLINSGLQVVFSSGNIFPSGRLYAFKDDDTPTIHFGAASFNMPFVLDRKRVLSDPRDFIAAAFSPLERIVSSYKKLAMRITRVIELDLSREPSYTFHLTFAGLEAGLLLHMPVFSQTFDDPKSYKRLVLSYASELLEETINHSTADDVPIFSTFYTPVPYLSFLTAFHYKHNNHLNINPLSPFSFNRKLRTAENLLELESSLQGILRDSISILDIRTVSLTGTRLKEIFMLAQRKGLKQFTITLTGLYVCNTCGHVIPSRASRCPRCYSRDLSGMVKPQLFYVKRERLDKWTLEEVDNRVVLA
ncbi:ArsR family transcriptional regulator [Infirmifilum uzonense]|uniref:ArsR family transcriptional regulator n=1 Tax=Infirmifilum uzonense TaxID=1550241 RepID=UPI003C71DCA9